MFYREELRKDWGAYKDLCAWFKSNRIDISSYLKLYFPTFKFHRYRGSDGLPILTNESLEYMKKLKQVIESENHKIIDYAVGAQIRKRRNKKK
jgi:hypothetical protein